MGTCAEPLSPERWEKTLPLELEPRAQTRLGWGLGGAETNRSENEGKWSCSQHLVSDLQSGQGARGPRSAELLGQTAGGQKEPVKFQYSRDPGITRRKVRDSSPKSSRLSSRLLGWAELKRFLKVM